MVWGGIWSGGQTDLYILPKDRTMRNQEYRECLKTHMLPTFRAKKLNWFLDDRAPCHKHQSVTTFLAEKKIKRMEWPGNSPDLNPIENVWANMKRRLRDTDVSTRPKMIRAVRKVWRETSRVELKNLAQSMPRRIQEVLEREGGSSKY